MKHFVLTVTSLLLSVSLLVNNANAQCTAYANNNATAPNTAGANDASVGSLAWANPTDIRSTDGTYATVDALLGGLSTLTTVTQYLTVTNLGFNIPPTQTICGIGVTVNRRSFSVLSLGSSNTTDNSIKLIKAGVITGTDHAATSTAWPTSTAPASYGGAGDTWGATLLPADVNASNFGVAISAKLFAAVLSVAFAAQIDQVQVTVYTSTGGPLPVHIQSFTAVAKPTVGNVLNWTASANDAGNRMVVERSADGVNWEELTVMTAGELEQGYTYTDGTPLLGNNFYRLHLLNSDGSVAYSQVVKVDDGNTPTGISLYPNPIVDMINVTGQKAFSRLVLHDLQGKTLYIKEYSGGVNSAQIPASNLPAGLYFVQVDGTTYKVVKK